MSDYDRNVAAFPGAARTVAVDAGLRAHMIRVYNYMAGGVALTGVVVFAGLTAWDTQKIKEMYDVNDDGTVSGRKAVMGALSLYLDFINLFLMLLRLFGDRR